MISLNSLTRTYPPINFKSDPVSEVLNQPQTQGVVDFFIQKSLSQKFKEQGDEYTKKSQNDKAIFYYEKAIEKKKDYPAPYYNLAKIYEKNGNTDEAIEVYTSLLALKPDELEARTLLGNCYKQKGDYDLAKQQYKEVFEFDPKYDFASRNLLETEYLILSRQNPKQAELFKQKIAKKNINKIRSLVTDNAPKAIADVFNDTKIEFNYTDSLSGYKNIAQYENSNNRIVVTKDYIWAAPEISAAYVIHEAVHAKDKDGITSIREEQDAYEESIKFWRAHNNGVKDLELDYAADLYNQNPQKLREKVGQVYRERDPSILEYSPYHTPPEGVSFNESIKLGLIEIKSQLTRSLGLEQDQRKEFSLLNSNDVDCRTSITPSVEEITLENLIHQDKTYKNTTLGEFRIKQKELMKKSPNIMQEYLNLSGLTDKYLNDNALTKIKPKNWIAKGVLWLVDWTEKSNNALINWLNPGLKDKGIDEIPESAREQFNLMTTIPVAITGAGYLLFNSLHNMRPVFTKNSEEKNLTKNYGRIARTIKGGLYAASLVSIVNIMGVFTKFEKAKKDAKYDTLLKNLESKLIIEQIKLQDGKFCANSSLNFYKPHSIVKLRKKLGFSLDEK